MADEPQFSPEDRALFEAEVERLRRQELPRAREEEIKAAAQRAVQRDLDLERETYREELNSEVARTTAETVDEERAEARREAPSKILMLVILLLLLMFILAATGQWRRFSPGRAEADQSGLTAKGALGNILAGPTTTPIGAVSGTSALDPRFAGQGNPDAGGIDAPGSVVPLVAGVDPFFWPYYGGHDGLRVFGLPISQVTVVNGRTVQWFERARLEYWPEHAGTPYEIQPGLVGREYTQGRSFPTQAFFPSRPGLAYFPETPHGVGGLFLEYWTSYGGLDIFGYPISEEIPEVLEDGRVHTVQYFERARMELHPELPGGEQVMLGLLGRALYFQEARPEQIPPPQPTPVPLP